MKDIERALGKLKTVDARVLYAAFGIVILLFLAGDFFLILRPQISGLFAQNDKNIEMKEQIEKLQNDKQHVDQFRKGLLDMKAKALDFDRMVFSKESIPAALQKISTFANEYGVKLDQLVPQKEGQEQLVKNTDGVYKSMAILVGARSGYHDFGRFLNRLENEKVFLKLDELTFSADELNPQKHLVKMVIRIVVLEK